MYFQAAGLEVKDPTEPGAPPIEQPQLHVSEKLNEKVDVGRKSDVAQFMSQTASNANKRETLPLAVDTLKYDVLLNSNYIPNTVFYIWCGKRWLEFHHYLSIKSVIQELRPDNLILYYDEEPVQDYWIYNTWFKELKEEYPFFRPRKLGDKEAWGKACDGLAKPSLQFIHKRLEDRGGMYMSEYTILNSFPMMYRSFSVVNALDEKTLKGFLMAKAGIPLKDTLKEVSKTKVKHVQCASSNSTYNKSPKKPVCVNTKNMFFPENIWELDTDFGKLTRKIFYGTTKTLKPQPSYNELVPNIAHIVWIGGGDMDFLFYLSVLSLIYVAKVENVYIHGNGPPKGPYWNRIKNHKQLHLIYRETPKIVYGTEVNVLSHITDVWRVDFMIRYGGRSIIYLIRQHFNIYLTYIYTHV